MTDEQQATPAPAPVPPMTDEDRQQIEKAIEQGTATGSYLVAVFHITEDRKVRLDRVSRSFPMVDFDNAVALLKQDLDGEKAGQIAQRETMVEAAPAAPVVDLFGKPPE